MSRRLIFTRSSAVPIAHIAPVVVATFVEAIDADNCHNSRCGGGCRRGRICPVQTALLYCSSTSVNAPSVVRGSTLLSIPKNSDSQISQIPLSEESVCS
ncbi:hypothetical protein QUB19_15670 [Microcoleus sp. B4-C5]|uniref:hypothetical protein n=1 Tax=unclassified Microcoleus TaxID=2642155 RepID=UPI002FD3B8E4